VKVRGFRIEIGEVEAACRQVPGVTNVAVTPRVESGAVVSLTAFVTPASADAAKILRRCKASLPIAAVPAAIVCLDQMPLTANGKIDHDTLRTRYPGS
jgi:acyl-coenzyme A synthetase/AMP-(fatty) acid ligase